MLYEGTNGDFFNIYRISLIYNTYIIYIYLYTVGLKKEIKFIESNYTQVRKSIPSKGVRRKR
jgi:hypothetical protein